MGAHTDVHGRDGEYRAAVRRTAGPGGGTGLADPVARRSGTRVAAASKAPLTLDLYTAFEDAQPLAQDWDSFVENVDGDLYTSFDWCSVWWRHYGTGRNLKLCVLRDGTDIVAVLPLFSETLWHGLVPVRVVRVLGCDHTVTNCGVAIRREYLTEAARTLIEHLSDVEDWDLLHLGPLAGYADQADRLPAAFESCREVGKVELDRKRFGVQTLLDLPPDYAEYLRSLPRNERRDGQRRFRRMMEQTGYESRVVKAPDALMKSFDDLLSLHEAQWASVRLLGHFGDWPGAAGFHRDMLNAQSKLGRPHFLEIRADGELLATQYEYRFGTRVHSIMCARAVSQRWRPYSPGKLAYWAAVEHAIRSGANLIDDLRGRYAYKLRLGGRVVPLASVAVLRQGSARGVRVKLLRSAANLLHLVYYRCWFNRVSSRVPSLRRPLWEPWIRSRL